MCVHAMYVNLAYTLVIMNGNKQCLMRANVIVTVLVMVMVLVHCIGPGQSSGHGQGMGDKHTKYNYTQCAEH